MHPLAADRKALRVMWFFLVVVGCLLEVTDAWTTTVTRSYLERKPVTMSALAPGDQEERVSITDLEEEDDSQARSAFGTKAYWDDVYAGRGDFPKDEYSW
jgi:hypothetical protein